MARSCSRRSPPGGGQARAPACEASMGLFDGSRRRPGAGARRPTSAALGMPVLLVLDVTGQAQSAGAVVKGCAGSDPRLRVAGVIVNQVGSPRHRRLVPDASRPRDPDRRRLPRNDHVALPGAISASSRPARPRSSRRGSRRSPISSRPMSISTASSLAGALAVARRVAGRPRFRPPGQQSRSPVMPRSRSFTRISCMAGARRGRDRLLLASGRRAAAGECDLCWLPGGYPELHAGRLPRRRAFAMACGVSPKPASAR